MTRLAMLAASFAIICSLSGVQVQSAPISFSSGLAGSPLTQQIAWRGCEFWQAKCAVRWGPGTWQFGRCLYRHGC
jgi:hypothetical protein